MPTDLASDRGDDFRAGYTVAHAIGILMPLADVNVRQEQPDVDSVDVAPRRHGSRAPQFMPIVVEALHLLRGAFGAREDDIAPEIIRLLTAQSDFGIRVQCLGTPSAHTGARLAPS